jgi:flagellar biogenesis protein FliO
LIGSQAKPDILTGPDIGKDHTIESPLQVAGEGWKMIAYLIPTLAFILVCLNLLRRYQQKTGRLPAGLRTASSDFGRASQGVGSAISGLLSFTKSGMGKSEASQGIRLLESRTIGASSLHLVQVRERTLLLSSSATGVALLTEFQEEGQDAADEFRSLLQSARAEMDAHDAPGEPLPASAVVGSLDGSVRETADAMARRLQRLRMASESEERGY